MKKSIIFIFLFLFFQISNQACTDTNCFCCKNQECTSDILTCPLAAHSDFNILVTTLIIIGSFAIGLNINLNILLIIINLKNIIIYFNLLLK